MRQLKVSVQLWPRIAIWIARSEQRERPTLPPPRPSNLCKGSIRCLLVTLRARFARLLPERYEPVRIWQTRSQLRRLSRGECGTPATGKTEKILKNIRARKLWLQNVRRQISLCSRSLSLRSLHNFRRWFRPNRRQGQAAAGRSAQQKKKARSRHSNSAAAGEAALTISVFAHICDANLKACFDS